MIKASTDPVVPVPKVITFVGMILGWRVSTKYMNIRAASARKRYVIYSSSN